MASDPIEYTIVDDSDGSVSTTRFTLNPDMTFTGTEQISHSVDDETEWESATINAYSGSYTTDGTIHTLVNDGPELRVTFELDTEHRKCTIK
jgi:hypothetical protein